MRRKAFTLIELLVVIAIIALLLAVVVPAIRKAKEVAKRVLCGSGARQTTIAARSYGDSYDGKLIPLAHIQGGGNLQTGAGVIYSDNRGTTPWTAFIPWMGVVSQVVSTTGVPMTYQPKGYHLGTLSDLGFITNPEVFYCPAQPPMTPLYPIPYTYDAYTEKERYEWGRYCPIIGTSGFNNPFVRTSYNYWVHRKVRWTELISTKIVLVDNLQEWYVIPHRKAGMTSSPQGVTVAYADAHVEFRGKASVLDENAVYNSQRLWPGARDNIYDNGPGNSVSTFETLLMLISQ